MDPLTNIQHHLQAVNLAEVQLDDAVSQAREAGHSWAEIGAVMNISRQAAFKRFGSVKDPTTGEMMTPRDTTTIPTIAEKFIRHIAAGEEAQTMAMLHKRFHKDLPWPEIMSVWNSVITEIGELEGFSDTVVTTVKGDRTKESLLTKLYTKIIGTCVVVTTLEHEAGELMARVAIDRDGYVVGILLLPTDVTEYAF